MLKNGYDLEKKLQSLQSLYDKDPDQFEDLRREIINQTISSYPEKFQKRARGLQFTLDCELNKYRNPVVRMNRMVELFWEKFYEFQTAITAPNDFTAARKQNKKAGKVIPLH